MDNQLHFISGLPRSGSTLLSALLRQNPKFRAGMSGPVGPLVVSMLKAMSMANETSVFIDDDQRAQLLRGIFETFHGGLPADHVSFDTNRLWCSKLSLLDALYPQAKVICCVRNVANIIGSVERLVQKNVLQPSGIFGFEPAGTIYSRADAIGGGSGMVGSAYNGLREAYFGPYGARLLFVTYETLTADPAHALGAVYDFIGAPRFEHDLADIRFDATEFDRRLGTPGLHEIGREIRVGETRDDFLPPDIAAKYAHDNFWRDPATNRSGVKVI